MRLKTIAPALVAFDVDGTLLRGETVCQHIGRSIGKAEEMRAFERLTSRAEIAAGRREMLQWYKPYDRKRLLECLRKATLAPGTRAGLAQLRNRGIKIALVSTTWHFAVAQLAEELGADYSIGTGWLESDEVADFWPDDKATWLSELLAQLGLAPDALVAVGDSAGDIPMLKLAGRGYFVGPSMPELPPHIYHWPAANIAALVDDAIGSTA